MVRIWGLGVGVMALLALAQPAAAQCGVDPDFPVPDDVRLIQLKQKDGEATAAEEDFLLTSYNKDRKQYMDVYEQLYPCALYADEVVSNDMPEEQQAVLKQELLLLERKWGQQGATAENRAAAEEFVDVSEDEMMTIE